MSSKNDYWAYLTPQDSDLAHHGVRGMKWGNRKGKTDGAQRTSRQDSKKFRSNKIGIEVSPIEVWALGKAIVDSMLGGGDDGL